MHNATWNVSLSIYFVLVKVIQSEFYEYAKKGNKIKQM